MSFTRRPSMIAALSDLQSRPTTLPTRSYAVNDDWPFQFDEDEGEEEDLNAPDWDNESEDKREGDGPDGTPPAEAAEDDAEGLAEPAGREKRWPLDPDRRPSKRDSIREDYRRGSFAVTAATVKVDSNTIKEELELAARK
jgi:hypothetical protein